MKHINTLKPKSLDQHLAAIDDLMQQFIVANSPVYKVSVLDSKYHVVNMRTNITHTVWPTMDSAMQSMRDLNRFAKRSA